MKKPWQRLKNPMKNLKYGENREEWRLTIYKENKYWEKLCIQNEGYFC